MTEALGVDGILKKAMACSSLALLRYLPAPAELRLKLPVGRGLGLIFDAGSLNLNSISLPGKGEGTDPPHVNRA